MVHAHICDQWTYTHVPSGQTHMWRVDRHTFVGIVNVLFYATFVVKFCMAEQHKNAALNIPYDMYDLILHLA
jgi:hypothetical protein